MLDIRPLARQRLAKSVFSGSSCKIEISQELYCSNTKSRRGTPRPRPPPKRRSLMRPVASPRPRRCKARESLMGNTSPAQVRRRSARKPPPARRPRAGRGIFSRPSGGTAPASASPPAMYLPVVTMPVSPQRLLLSLISFMAPQISGAPLSLFQIRFSTSLKLEFAASHSGGIHSCVFSAAPCPILPITANASLCKYLGLILK